jgi:hypothetical protein
MRSGLLLDPEGRPAPILEHLDDSALIGRGRKPDPAARGDDDIFLSADQHGPPIRPGGDDGAGLKRRASGGGRASAALLDLHRSRGFGHPPGRYLGECGMAPEEQQDDKGSQEHVG